MWLSYSQKFQRPVYDSEKYDPEKHIFVSIPIAIFSFCTMSNVLFCSNSAYLMKKRDCIFFLERGWTQLWLFLLYY